MSVTGFASSPAEFDDETRHIVAPPACSEHHLHHHHHREALLNGANQGIPGVEAVSSAGDDKEEGELVITAAQKMLAACSGSLLTSLLVTPLDVVRVRLQSQHRQPSNTSTPATAPTNIPETSLRAYKLVPPQFQSTWVRLPTETGVTACCREVFWNPNNAEFCVVSSSNSTSPAFSDACAIEETSRRRFTGTWEGLVKIARYEGTTSLWRGLSPTLLMAIPANVIYFTGYDSLRTSPVSPFSQMNSTWAPLLAGASARAIAATAISPLELFRTRLWAISAPKANGNGNGGVVNETGVFRKTVSGLVGMVKSEGWTSLWRGLTLTLWRDVPFSGIYWFGYETIKKRLQAQNFRRSQQLFPLNSSKDKVANTRANTFTDSFIAGALSGMVAAFLTTPFDVGKTRIQVSQHTPRTAADGPAALRAGYGGATRHVYTTMPSLLHGIWKEEGVRGLWRGCAPRMLKVAPACAIMISSYEVGKQWAEKHNQTKREMGE
ncbi:mitochondrial carrier [Terfezia boudieri ATCC MYA-4762]|uniref:Mitochondrial carrier n=1 Tax=Terfezia boudieri ATCC MYA-4762 TaxID=1051890 RepID=A0A3N4LHP7_9PEZI|nr:mitochondrial carrier [Terfezia boudieri ATCC MYA-4762]